MNDKVKSAFSFVLAGVFGLIAVRFLIVQVADATIVDLVLGFGSAVASLSSLSFGVSKLVK